MQICFCQILLYFVLVGTKQYQIIEFINEKKGNVLCVDFVPSKWISYDDNLCTCVTKFMPPPYDKKNMAKLCKLVEEKADALEDWSFYPVRLRGDAGKHKNCFCVCVFQFPSKSFLIRIICRKNYLLIL